MKSAKNFILGDQDAAVFAGLEAALYRLLREGGVLSAQTLHSLSYVLLAVQSLPHALQGIRFNLTIEHPDYVASPSKSLWQFLYSSERLVLGRMNMLQGVITADTCETLHEASISNPCYAKDGLIWCKEVQHILDIGRAHFSIEGDFSHHPAAIWKSA